MDWATFAGMVAAESILEGCRAGFDRRADPTRRYEENARIEVAEEAVGAAKGGLSLAGANRAPSD
jgi:hypothetical protein